MPEPLSRRRLLKTVAGVSAASALTACHSEQRQSFTLGQAEAGGLFAHGLASGDPTSSAIILWTRLTPSFLKSQTDENKSDENRPIPVKWEVCQNPDFKIIDASGTVQANPARDYTVKVDADGLRAGTTYYYRFGAGDRLSPVGKTATLPADSLQKARFAIVSCANWQHGLFNAYDHISRQNHFDALIHLGDYYYEYGAGRYISEPMKTMGRVHKPAHETVTLEDYRTRHAQYRSDPALQALSAKMPFIVIWDDHETANDSWQEGAENHQVDEGEGEWSARKKAALRAYFEWMPIREPKGAQTPQSLFRSYEYGDLLTLMTLETRLLARGEQIIIDDYFDMLREQGGPERFRDDVLNDPTRDMLGAAQLEAIANVMKQSKAAGKPWRLFANQVVMGEVLSPDLRPYVDEAALQAIEKVWDGVRQFVDLSQYNLPVYPDSWDGYPVARERLYKTLAAIGVEDMLVITGDAHEYWVNDLTRKDGTKMGVELCTTSVSSETLRAFMGDGTADYALLLTQKNKDVRYYNAMNNGYLDLELTRTKAKARLIAVDRVDSHDYTAFEAANFTLKPTKNTLKATAPKGLNFKQRLLFHGLG